MLKREDAMIVTQDDGGYRSGFCCLCRVRGWIDKIIHKLECPFYNKDVKEADVGGD
jgi:hypothetical protein